MTKLASLFLAALIALATACGSDDGSGVDPAKSLNDVTVDEAIAICEASASQVSDAKAKKVSCYIFAIAFSETAEECETNAQACIAEPDDPMDESTCDVTQADIDMQPDCASMVTVGEIEACNKATADAINSLGNTISCSTTEEELNALDPPECAAAEEKCPGLFE